MASWRKIVLFVIVAVLLSTQVCIAAAGDDVEDAPPVTKGKGKVKGKLRGKARARAAAVAAAAAAAAEGAESSGDAADSAADSASADAGKADEPSEDAPTQTKASGADPADSADADADAAPVKSKAKDAEPADADSAPADADADADAVAVKKKGTAAKAEAEEETEAEPEAGAGADAAPTSSKKAAQSFAVLPKSASSKDDISPEGNCTKDVTMHCKGVTPGKSNLANCITFHVKNEKSGNDANVIPVSDGCKAEVRAFKIDMYRDLSMDPAMAEACKDDIRKNCDDDFLYPEPGNIVACLREVNQVDKLSDTCKAQVMRAQLAGAEDFKADPQLNELCSSEADRLCKGVEPGEGRVQDCLRSHRDKLAWDCQAELFRQEVENADDIRLNVRLFQACLNDQRQFCGDVAYGDARVKDCLEQHRQDPEFSPRCKTEFDMMMERRATDFRLDSSLRKYCKADITEICYPDAEDISDVANWDAKVIQCLQDYRDELKDQRCRTQVHKLTQRAAEDLRFDKPLADACYSDRQKLCKDIPDGMAQVFMCLQEHQSELKDVCRSALFDELVRFAEDIDFKFPMQQACSKELSSFCKDVPAGHAAKVQCLQDKIDDPEMGEDCKKEMNRDLQRSAEDYRLNYRLNKACLADVTKLCAHACDRELEAGSVTCGGTVLKCLQDNNEKLESEACKKELFNFDKMEARDPLQFDFPLQRACAENITSLCQGVSKDHALTLACLRQNRADLGADCAAEEKRFSIMEASDIRLTPPLMNACGQELQGFCRDVPPSGGAAFKCLQQHLEDVRMGAACKGEVNLEELRHASNYRLDVRVRTECSGDVEKWCKDVDAGEEGHSLVLKCMVEHKTDLSQSCLTEVSYAVRMALWQYKTSAPLTTPCDSAVESLCRGSKAKEINGVVIGVFGQCLTSASKADKEGMDPRCQELVGMVAQEAVHAGGNIDPEKLEETLKKIAELQAAVGAAATEGEEEAAPEGLVITGWMAATAVGALVLVLVAVAYAVYTKFFSPTRNYTMVVKGGGPPGV